MFDLAFRTNDEAAIEKAIERFAKIEGKDGVLGMFAEVGLQICRARKGDPEGLAKAKDRLAKLGTEAQGLVPRRPDAHRHRRDREKHRRRHR